MTELPYVIDTGLTWPNGRTERIYTDHIQIHHTVGNYGTPEDWAALHRKKQRDGHKGVGYSYLICADGSIFLGRGHQYAHGGVKDSKTINEQGIGANQRSISIALDGDMREADRPTDAQIASLIKLVNDLKDMYGLTVADVLGHNEVPTYEDGKPTGKGYATLCPCLNMDEIRAAIAVGGLDDGNYKPEQDNEREDEEPRFPALYKYIGASYVNLRSGASTKYEKVGKVSKGDKVIVLGTNGEWCEVITHETTPMLRGWCILRYLAEV